MTEQCAVGAGVFTGHSHGKNGLPLSFGKGTYYNIFDANDEFEHCDPGMFGATAADCMACPANSFCMGGKTPEKCPDNTVAPPGSHKVFVRDISEIGAWGCGGELA